MLVILQNTLKSYVWPINESRYMIWLFVAEIRTQYTPARVGIIFLPFSGRYGHFRGIICIWTYLVFVKIPYIIRLNKRDFKLFLL